MLTMLTGSGNRQFEALAELGSTKRAAQFRRAPVARLAARPSLHPQFVAVAFDSMWYPGASSGTVSRRPLVRLGRTDLGGLDRPFVGWTDRRKRFGHEDSSPQRVKPRRISDRCERERDVTSRHACQSRTFTRQGAVVTNHTCECRAASGCARTSDARSCLCVSVPVLLLDVNWATTSAQGGGSNARDRGVRSRLRSEAPGMRTTCGVHHVCRGRDHGSGRVPRSRHRRERGLRRERRRRRVHRGGWQRGTRVGAPFWTIVMVAAGGDAEAALGARLAPLASSSDPKRSGLC